MHVIHGGYSGVVEDFVAERCIQDPREDRTHWDEVWVASRRILPR